MQRRSAIYILTNRRRGVLYTGVTRCLRTRLLQHLAGEGSIFVRRYKLRRLVYVEFHHDLRSAIQREKCVKEWRRAWKLELIEAVNPEWLDQAEDILVGTEFHGCQ